MDKQSTIAIIAVVIISLVIAIIIAFTDRTKEEEKLDTSLFNVLTTREAIEMMEKNTSQKAKFFYIGREDCSACKEFNPYIRYSLGLAKYEIFYIELNRIKDDEEAYNTLVKKLSEYEYVYEGETKTFDNYLGYTPMLFIVKNNKLIYGSIGGMKSQELADLVTKYGVAYEEEN